MLSDLLVQGAMSECLNLTFAGPHPEFSSEPFSGSYFLMAGKTFGGLATSFGPWVSIPLEQDSEGRGE